jgi:hypothetical protein
LTRHLEGNPDTLSGELKMMTVEKAPTWSTVLAEMRVQNAHLVEEFLADDIFASRMSIIQLHGFDNSAIGKNFHDLLTAEESTCVN